MNHSGIAKVSTSDAVNTASKAAQKAPAHKRKAANAMLQPFLQFKLLLYMLGSSVIVAVLLAVFLYFAFSGLLNTLSEGPGAASYYAEMIEIQLVHLFRYCAVLFLLYIIILAVVCIAYTHKLIGPFQPFNRHIDSLIAGDYNARVSLRKGDPDLLQDYADKLNVLADQLDKQK